MEYRVHWVHGIVGEKTAWFLGACWCVLRALDKSGFWGVL